MTEDILEQLVDGWFRRKESVFTKHNVKYRPDTNKIILNRNKYSVHSDIDVIAVDFSDETKKVSVVSCKSWQEGFDVKQWWEGLCDTNKNNQKIYGKEKWKHFRELTDPIWAQAFKEKILSETGSDSFTYYIAVTKLKNEDSIDAFKSCKCFLDNLRINEDSEVTIEFLTIRDMLNDILDNMKGTTVESTEIGRFIQLIKAAGLEIK